MPRSPMPSRNCWTIQQLRLTMALRARARVSQDLDWRPQARAYVSVYDDMSGIRQDRIGGPSSSETAASARR